MRGQPKANNELLSINGTAFLPLTWPQPQALGFNPLLSPPICPCWPLCSVFTSIFTRELSRNGKDEAQISEFYLYQSSQLPFSTSCPCIPDNKTAFFLCKMSWHYPPCHSNLYHFIHVIISWWGLFLASLYSQSPLHFYSLLLAVSTQASLGSCPTPSLTSSVVKVQISYIIHHGPPQVESNWHSYP